MASSGATLIPAEHACDFLLIAGKLKRAVRTGWVLRKVKEAESVAEHSWRMAVLSFLLMGEGKTADQLLPGLGFEAGRVVSADRMMKIALVHDLAEALVGDITPLDGISKEEKHALEAQAMRFIAGALMGEQQQFDSTGGGGGGGGGASSPSAHGKAISEALLSAYQEYESASATPEALIVKDFDKLEMLQQALEYELEQRKVDLSSFFEGTREKIKSPFVRAMADEVYKRRDKLRAERKQEMAVAVGDGSGGGDTKALPVHEEPKTYMQLPPGHQNKRVEGEDEDGGSKKGKKQRVLVPDAMLEALPDALALDATAAAAAAAPLASAPKPSAAALFFGLGALVGVSAGFLLAKLVLRTSVAALSHGHGSGNDGHSSGGSDVSAILADL